MSDDTHPRQRPVVLAGPTAVGKGTVSAYIRDHFPEVWLSVSATTRPARPGEIDGRHYFFVSAGEFAPGFKPAGCECSGCCRKNAEPSQQSLS